MILYSCVPEEQVFEGWDTERAHPVELRLDGLLLQVQPISATQASIVRLICPDPQQYLNPAYAPGHVIEYRPTLL